MTRIFEKIPYNFGGIPEAFSSYENAKVAILPVPYDGTVSYRCGAREGPGAMIKASQAMELYDRELGGEFYRELGIHTCPQILPKLASPEDVVKAVEESVMSAMGDGKRVVVFGGEHTVSVGAVLAARSFFPSLSVLQLDAHPDLMDTYQGTPFSHACVARRVHETCPIVVMGTRCMSGEEEAYAQAEAIPIVEAEALRSGVVSPEEALAPLSGDVYVSIDLDVFDPGEMPAVGTPEPGGLGWYDVLGILRAVAAERNVVGFDLVELAPIPGNVAPDYLAARLAYKAMGLFFRGG